MPIQGQEVYSTTVKQATDELTEATRKYLAELEKVADFGAKITGAKGLKGLKTATDELNKSTEKLNEDQKKLAELMTREAQTVNEARKQNIQLRKVRGDINIKTKEGKAEIEKLNKQIDRNNKLVKQNVDGLTRQKIGIGKYTQAIQGAVVKLGLMFAGAKTLIRGIGNLIKISSDFEKQMDKVEAITGSTSEEMDMLKKLAKDLGASTTKTATEVGMLSEELAKLGFITSEILASTGGILALSEATGSDLAQAAKVAGATIRGFGLDASESTRIVDVMTKSFSSSALDLNKFEVAMAQVAPVAKTTNITLEESTAMLSALVDSGLDASTAGTSLRNIMLENAKAGRSFNEAMQLMNGSTNKSVTALELFGKRGAVAAIILSDNIEKTAGLTEKYEKAAGTAQEMADIMRNNLAGDITIAKSAWQGFVLSIEDGSGGINRFLRGLVQQFTSVVTALRNLQLSDIEFALQKTFEAANEEVEKFKNNLIEGITPAQYVEAINIEIERQNEIIESQNKLIKENNNLMKVDSFRAKQYKDQNLELTGFIALAQNQINILNTIKAAKEADIELTIKQIEANKKLSMKRKKTLEEELEEIRANYIEEEEINIDFIYRKMDEEKKYTEFLQEEINKRNEAEFEANIKRLEAEAKLIEQKKIKDKEYFESSKSLGFELLDLGTSIYNRELELTQQKIDNKELSEKEGAKKIAEIQRKQAILNKSTALADIAINTAVAVSRIWRDVPKVDFGITTGILTGVAIATGLAQSAIVLSQPLPTIPSYFVGSGGKKVSGLMEVHGQEGIRTDDGIFKTDWGKYEGRMINLNTPSEIISNEDFIKYDINRISNIDNGITLQGGISKEEFEKISETQTVNIVRALKNIPIKEYDLAGNLMRERRRNSWIEYKKIKY